MTGLNPAMDSILSLSCLITDASLDVLDAVGFDATIHHRQSVLSGMDPWCTRTHTASGLVSACLSSTTTAEAAAQDLLSYIQTHVPECGVALLAGNSIHADRAFLAKEPWSKVLGWLHYRVLDVSSVKEGVRRWAPTRVVEGVPAKRLRHVARGDVEESIAEARYYMGVFQGLALGVGSGGGGGREEELNAREIELEGEENELMREKEDLAKAKQQLDLQRRELERGKEEIRRAEKEELEKPKKGGWRGTGGA